MNIVSVRRRLGRLAISLSLVVSISASISLLFSSNGTAIARAAQKRAASTPNESRTEIDNKTVTRARRAELQSDGAQHTSIGGPIIRVALMTDVSSIALSSSSGLIVRRGVETELDERKNVLSGPLTVELRQIPERAATLKSSLATYRVSVGSSNDSRAARKLVDELKKKFFEPVAMTFDEKEKEYSVLIGQFASRSEAAQFLERLRRSGYESLRIVSEQKSTDPRESESIIDSNARTARPKAQPGNSSAPQPSGRTDRRPTQLVALAADKVSASSETELVFAPAEGPERIDLGRQSTGSLGDDRDTKRVTGRAQSESNEPQNRAYASPAVVRIGKTDYRGEITVVRNSRGRINVVNSLPLEDYLRGVVPMELSPGAYPEIEALKAQAVAARSYALDRLGRHRDDGYDLVDDTRAQVYGGFSAERELTNRAIDATRGIAAVFSNEDG